MAQSFLPYDRNDKTQIVTMKTVLKSRTAGFTVGSMRGLVISLIVCIYVEIELSSRIVLIEGDEPLIAHAVRN